MDVGAALVADPEAPVLVEPGERSLDDPSFAPESGAVLALPGGDLGLDVAGAQGGALLP